MTEKESEQVKRHYDADAAGYGWRYNLAALPTAERYSANYFRLRLMIDRLTAIGARTIFEVGVGDGTALAIMAKRGFSVAGCDFSSRMVDEAKANMRKNELDPDAVFLGDIEKKDTISQFAPGGEYDAVIAAGVMPHVQDQILALTNMSLLVRPGGALMIEFRNKLFSLFTFNRHTKNFILDDLLTDVGEDIRSAVGAELDQRCATDLPALRVTRADGAPDYDAIQARFNNPFEIPELFSSAGLNFRRFHWYHFHAAPPLVEPKVGCKAFRSASMSLEGRTDDWRGYFLCSAFVAEAARNV